MSLLQTCPVEETSPTELLQWSRLALGVTEDLGGPVVVGVPADFWGPEFLNELWEPLLDCWKRISFLVHIFPATNIGNNH